MLTREQNTAIKTKYVGIPWKGKCFWAGSHCGSHCGQYCCPHFVNLAGWQNGGKQYNIESERVKQVYTVQ